MPAASSASTMPQVDVVLVRGQLERREEHARHAAVDVLPAQLPGAILLRAPAPLGLPQSSACCARQRRRHHALADRLEDLGLARDRESAGRTRARRRGRRALTKVPEPARRSTRPASLQVAHGAADRDPRGAERLPELRLARQASAIGQPAGLDVAPEGGVDLPVLGGRRARCVMA